MKKTLAELKAANLPKASAEDLIAESLGETPDLTKINEYLKIFAKPAGDNWCPACGSGFVWGFTHGEGHCHTCNYPARAYHYDMPGTTAKRIIGVLWYHPDVLEEAQPESA